MPEKPRHSAFMTTLLAQAGQAMNRTLVLPLLIYYPTSRCNSRCLSCDWWRHTGADDLGIDEIARVAAALPALGTRVVAFSGGEPLLRPEVFEAAAVFRAQGVRLHLLTSGVLLERFAARVAEHFARVTISLDASTEALYQAVRGVAALTTVERGVACLRRAAPHVPVTARATLHRANFRELPALIAHAKRIGVDGISFLAADVSSTAFGRQQEPFGGQALRLAAAETEEFAALVEETIVRCRDDFESGFVAESPDGLRRLPQYYAALTGGAPFPPVACNAPWVSVVVEAVGNVSPRFFHDGIGNVRQSGLAEILAGNLRTFRHDLDVSANPVCRRCVCSIRAGWRNAPWQ